MELLQSKEHTNKPQGHPQGYKMIIQCGTDSERVNGAEFDSGCFWKMLVFLFN